MPIADRTDEEVVRLVTEEAKKYKAKVKQIDLTKQIFDIECPEENRTECAIAIQKVLDKRFGG